MYGEHDDPVAVLTKLGKRLEYTPSPQDALSGITESVAWTLKIPYVAIELAGKHGVGEIIAAYGLPKGKVLRLPMKYQNTTNGTLLLAQRSPGELFNSSERSLLGNIACQAGAAARAVKLTADWRQSRQ